MDKELLERCRDNPKLVDWIDISINQILSEDFIREFSDNIGWTNISHYQILSEDFIREFKDRVYWHWISRYQVLSENFIREFKDRVNWYYISIHQVLSKNFIREFKDYVDWSWISFSQTLSENFIREFKDRADWRYISKYQILSENFIREFNIKVPNSSWGYKTPEEKLIEAKKAGYKVVDGKIIAYKSVKKNMTSVYKPGMIYEVGKYYQAHCDCLPESKNSFGLSAWTKKSALEYYSKGKLLEVEINPSDLGVIVYDDKKIRCFRLKVTREVGVR